MTIRPAYRPTIVKKRTKHFIRHQSDRYAKLSVSAKIENISETSIKNFPISHAAQMA